MLKYKNYIYVNLRSAEVYNFGGKFRNVPEVLKYASKKYTEELYKPHLRGCMVILNGNGIPLYPVGYKHPTIMSREVDIHLAQFYVEFYKLETTPINVSYSLS